MTRSKDLPCLLWFIRDTSRWLCPRRYFEGRKWEDTIGRGNDRVKHHPSDPTCVLRRCRLEGLLSETFTGSRLEDVVKLHIEPSQHPRPFRQETCQTIATPLLSSFHSFKTSKQQVGGSQVSQRRYNLHLLFGKLTIPTNLIRRQRGKQQISR